jgi:hypothetical protein
MNVAVVNLLDGRLQVFHVSNNMLWTRYKLDAADPHAQWSTPALVQPQPLTREERTNDAFIIAGVAGGRLQDGRLQLWVSVYQNGVLNTDLGTNTRTSWQTVPGPSSQFVDWIPYA